MKVKEFTRMDVGSSLFEVVDATRAGYMTKPFILTTADKNVVGQQYGEREIVSFEIKTKRTIRIYVK